MIPDLALNGLGNAKGTRQIKHKALVGLTFYPHHLSEPIGSDRLISPRVASWDPKKSEATITAFHWTKRIGSPCGNWSATLKVNHRTSKLDILGGDILPGDWVDGVINRNGIDFPLFRGVVDTVDQETRSAGGATIRNYLLTGRDHGAPIEAPLVYNNVWAMSLQQLTAGLFTAAVGGKVGGTPDQMFRTLIGAAFGSGGGGKSNWMLPWSMKANLYYGLSLAISTLPCRGWYYNEVQLWTKAGDTLQTALNQWCNPLLNEWVFDLPEADASDPWKMQALIRERPFITRQSGSSSPWFDLPTLELPSYALESLKLGRSQAERFNLIEVVAELGISQNEQYALVPPAWSRSAVEKYGLRPLLESTKFVGPAGPASWNQERRQVQDVLIDWHGPNPYWLSGLASTRLALPELRVGQRFKVNEGSPSSDITARVEGIDLAWSWTDPSRAPVSSTTLILTRGYQGPDTAALKLVEDAAAQYKDLK